MTEAQLEGRRPVIEALRAGRAVNEILLASGARGSKAVAEIRELAERARVPVTEVPKRELEVLARSRNPQGVIALVPSFAYADLGDVLTPEDDPALLVALDGITDPQNAGAIARSAEACGAHALLIPERRSVDVTPAVEKAAAGALTHLPVCKVPNLARALTELKAAGIWIVALDPAGSTTVFDLPLSTEPLCLVVGGEGGGVSRLVVERADQLVSIPMAGRVESLNASAAAAVALFEIRRQRT